MQNNILLIGMPGAGKSTVGVILAKTLGYGFIDTDLVLIRRIGMTLQEYLDSRGIERFLQNEEKAALSLDCSDTVIATGGSMVLSERAMAHLKAGAICVYLDVALPELQSRLRNIKTRGIAAAPGESLEDIYAKRASYYVNYADAVVPCIQGGADTESVVEQIIRLMRR